MFRIAPVYAPNRNPERDKFFTSCVDFAGPSVPTILCGDFNAVFDRAKDRRGSDPVVTVWEALSLWSYSSGSFVFWMFGAISILIFALLPG